MGREKWPITNIRQHQTLSSHRQTHSGPLRESLICSTTPTGHSSPDQWSSTTSLPIDDSNKYKEQSLNIGEEDFDFMKESLDKVASSQTLSNSSQNGRESDSAMEDLGARNPLPRQVPGVRRWHSRLPSSLRQHQDRPWTQRKRLSMTMMAIQSSSAGARSTELCSLCKPLLLHSADQHPTRRSRTLIRAMAARARYYMRDTSALSANAQICYENGREALTASKSS